MYAFQLTEILKNNYFSKKYFVGVYPSNRIPVIKKFPSAMIVNTDKSGNPGIHWQAIFIFDPDHAEFFDSFGRLPTGEIKKYLMRFRKLLINKEKVQANYEISCGPFVVYYVINRSRGKKMYQIIKDIKKYIFSDAFVKIYTSYPIP